MLKQLISAAIVSAIAATSANAMEITKGQLISHKEWSTSALVKGSLNEVTPSQHLEKRLSELKRLHRTQKDAGFDDIMAQNRIIKIIPNEITTVVGDSEIFILNLTGETHIYTMKTGTCILNSKTEPQCVDHEDVISLAHEGVINNAMQQTVHFIPVDGEAYTAYIITEVTRDDRESIFATLDKTDITMSGTTSSRH